MEQLGTAFFQSNRSFLIIHSFISIFNETQGFMTSTDLSYTKFTLSWTIKRHHKSPSDLPCNLNFEKSTNLFESFIWDIRRQRAQRAFPTSETLVSPITTSHGEEDLTSSYFILQKSSEKQGTLNRNSNNLSTLS
jgi:hypothetical protein